MKHLLVIVPFLFFVTLPAYAATISVTGPTEAPPAASFSIIVSVSADSNPVNVVEGNIDIPYGITIDSVTTAGSAFSLWTVYPTYFTTDRAVEFSGGSTSGVPADTTAQLFVIHAHADIPGVYALSLRGVSAYRDDGTGTSEDVDTRSTFVTVRAGAQAPAQTLGKAAPLVVNIGRDDALFDGQYFVAFYGGDRGAGVRYEVKEGDRTFVPADRYYLLRDQTLQSRILVRALDEKGVAAQVTLNDNFPLIPVLAVVLIALAALVWWYRVRRHRTI